MLGLSSKISPGQCANWLQIMARASQSVRLSEDKSKGALSIAKNSMKEWKEEAISLELWCPYLLRSR